MDKIKEIYQHNGTDWGDAISIGTDAKNIDVTDGDNSVPLDNLIKDMTQEEIDEFLSELSSGLPADYVKKSGDTMSGNLYFTGANNQSVGFMINNNGENFDCGWNYNNGGAGMALRSPNYGGSNNHGEFDIYARAQADEAYTKHLIGKADGSLTWGGNKVLTQNVWSSYINYTASTTYAGRGNITIPTNGIYKVRAAYSNSPVLTLGYGASNGTSGTATVILMDSSVGASLEVVTHLAVGTYKFWTKCGSNSGSQQVIVTRLIEI